MVIGEMKRLQVLAGIIDQYDEYFPNTEHVKLTESELKEFYEEWAILEDKNDKNELPIKLDKRTLEVAKVVILKLTEVTKKIYTIARALGAVGDAMKAIAIGMLKMLLWLWNKRLGVAIAASVGIAYNVLIGAINVVHEKAPRLTKGFIDWFFETPEKVPAGQLGTELDKITRENISEWWKTSADKLSDYEPASIVDLAKDGWREVISILMDGVAVVTPYFLDWSVMLLELFQKNGFGFMGSIMSWVFFIALLKGLWDIAFKIVSPIGKFIKKQIENLNIVLMVKDEVDDIPDTDEPRPRKELNPGGPISKDDAVKSISKPKPEIPGFKKSDDEPEIGVVEPDPK